MKEYRCTKCNRLLLKGRVLYAQIKCSRCRTLQTVWFFTMPPKNAKREWLWPKIRKKALERDKYKCVYCGKKASTVDHVIPRSKGGTDDISNLVASCKKCNNEKGAQ